MGEGIKLEFCVHKKCGKKKMIDYQGYVWCDFCKKIVDPEDILSEEGYRKYLDKK